jgi:two-component sensor histidine kinase
VYRSDLIGTVVGEDDRPLVTAAFRQGQILEGEMIPVKEVVRVTAIPVRWKDEVVAVLTREATPSFGRQPGELERIYVEVFNRFARMIAAGSFPFTTDEFEPEEAPRVGDGVILLDAQGRVAYTSPNAVSALHRVGVHANTEGMRLGDLGLDETPILAAMAGPRPVIEEIERGPEVTVLLQCLPLLDSGIGSETSGGGASVSGAVVLLRDISELRRRDRLLVSKDATIREIHHRVKNNLQTISSLLRLQGRRLESPEAKAAIEESVRRVRSIALVHEILSREAGDDVPFIDIVRPICRMVEEAFHSAERPVRFTIEGDAGNLPAQIATPLAVVLNELLQNAFDHAFPEVLPATNGEVVLSFERDAWSLVVRVVDDGDGLPAGFSVDAATGLGLSIVRTLVTSELGGSIEMFDANDAPSRRGTIVELRLPLENLIGPRSGADDTGGW